MTRDFLSAEAKYTPADEFDRQYQTETTAITDLASLQIESPNAKYGVRYQPTPRWVLELAIQSLNIKTSAFSFVDLGCGKGRALIIARSMNFRAVVGVEFSPQLLRIAQNNLTIANAEDVSLHYCDAADFVIPDGDTIAYLYNPFGEIVLRSVIGSFRNHRGLLYVVYYVPLHRRLFDSDPLFSFIGCPVWDIAVWRKL